jgi:hypothetical protein
VQSFLVGVMEIAVHLATSFAASLSRVYDAALEIIGVRGIRTTASGITDSVAARQSAEVPGTRDSESSAGCQPSSHTRPGPSTCRSDGLGMIIMPKSRHSTLDIHVSSRVQKIGLIGIFHESLEVIVFSLELLTYIKQLPAFVFPQVALHVFALKSPHFNSQALKPVVGLELKLPLHAKLLFQTIDGFRILVLHCLGLFISLNLSLEAFYLSVPRFELTENSIQVDVFQDLKIFHFVLELIHSLAFRVLVLLKASFLVVQIFKLALELLN